VIGHAPAPKPPNTSIPQPTITTINFNSLSAHATKRDSAQAHRHKQVIKAITKILDTSDILCGQETHLGANDTVTLRDRFPQHHILYNNDRLRHGGTIIMVHQRLLAHYTTSPVQLGRAAKGRIQAVRFNPKTSSRLPFLLVNVYLQADGDNAAINRQLREVLKIPNCPHTILLGDLNFVERQADAPSAKSQLPISGTPKKLWDKVLEHHQLSEVLQPLHTHYYITEQIENSRTSRIDRIYISHSPSDTTLVVPTAYVPLLPVNILNSYKSRLRGETVVKDKPFTDHLPVTLTFTDTTLSKKRAYNTPRWLADTPDFKASILDRCEGEVAEGCPFLALDRWKAAIKAACKAYFATRRAECAAYHSNSAELSASIRLLRLCLHHSPTTTDITNYITTHGALSHLITDAAARPVDTRDLREHIHNLLTNHDDETSNDEGGLDVLALPPSSTPTPSSTSSHTTMLDEIKHRLPSTRKQLRMLRADAKATPTSDPKKMAKIIKDFWSRIWAASGTSHSFSSLLSYLDNYTNHIPRHLTPSLPTLDDILKHIHGTNNSAPGPDGIPFAMYRLCAEFVGPILLRITHALARGETPPAGFNYARLFLIPKNSSLEIASTRPISVTNSDNRIIAKCLTTAITPALQAILHLAQKGFVPGRTGAEHILRLNEAYYSHLTRKQQYFILFLDTKKAFDSINHDFIIAVIDKMGMPQWFCAAIAGLLSDVRVYPVLAEDTGVFIPITRGVKQGCPLSPLLFAICYDVLLHALEHAHPDLDMFAFADDLALGSLSLPKIISALKIIRIFSSFSGLGLNIKKTNILTTTRPFYIERNLLVESGFGKIQFSTEAVYLGVLMGSAISTPDIFKAATAKFMERLVAFKPTLSTSSLHKRILIFNIFLLPIMYYLAQFFIIPPKVYVALKLATHKAVVAFHGGGFGYAHLISHRDLFGPHTPLRDLWATNMTLLATQFPTLPLSHGENQPEMGEFQHVDNDDWDSLLITEHRAHAAFTYLALFCPRDHNHAIVVDHLGSTPASARRTAYGDLVRNGYLQERSSHLKKYKSSLPNKLARTHQIPDPRTAATNLTAHARTASPRIRIAIRNAFLRCVHNALPTDCRRADAKMAVTQRPSLLTPSLYPCYLCGAGADKLHHLLNDCPVVAAALQLVSTACSTVITHNSATLLLTFPPTSTNLPTNVIITFIWSMWHQRTSHFATLAAPPPRTAAANRIATHTLDNIFPTSTESPKSNISTSAEIATLALDPPSTAINCFTDGSAMPNPGPAGAGLTCSSPTGPGSPRVQITAAIALGHGDNNLGELFGIYTALRIGEHLLANYPHTTPPPLLIFSDSLLSICYLLHGWSYKNCPPIGLLVKALLRRLSKSMTIRLYWVRGHAKVPGNERADAEAKTGARLNDGRHATPDAPYYKITCTANNLNLNSLKGPGP
jgi:ribonuclease HI/exonuclease III